jgi:hypothetical protein
MIQTVYRDDFHAAFKAIRPDNFTAAGRDALYDCLEEWEGVSGVIVKLDVIQLCVEYTEYASFEEFQKDYNAGEYQTITDIHDSMTIDMIEIPDTTGFIIQNF